MITIDELNKKYKESNPNWDFTGLESWLVKKGIAYNIINTTLKQTLLEFSPDTLPDTNFIFDNTVLLKALINKGIVDKGIMENLQKETQDSLKKIDTDWYSKSKLERIWLVLKGED
jgi:hypothetical protein